MKISKVEVKNYRSIKNLTMTFEHNCQVLIGLNESGKSNLLKSLSFLDQSLMPTNLDIRIESQDEEPLSEAYIRFIFELDELEKGQVYNKICKHFLQLDIDKTLVTDGKKKLNLFDFCNQFYQGLYIVNLKNLKCTFNNWALAKEKYIIQDDWKKTTGAGGLNETKSIGTLQEDIIEIDSNIFFSEKNRSESSTVLSKPIDINEIHSIIGREITEIIKSKMPKCVFWKYTESHVLPSYIDFDIFTSNINSCIPLKNMFVLAGYSENEIVSVLTDAKKSPPHIYINILKRVAKATTKYLHEVWKEHSSVILELNSDANKIIPTISGGAISLDMNNRSEGYKRFVSFLLVVAADSKTSYTNNTLIIIDEPENGLHPQGAKSLMNELIKISENNLVVYSTHSPFMIDKKNISRHIIVEKQKEITSIKRADKSKVQDEEVLYNAIGYSIFESLKQNNVIFEGWRDKKLFDLILSSSTSQNKNALKNIGLTFAEGVKDVKNLSKILELVSRGCLIISDADKPALEAKNTFELSNPYGVWVTLKDIFPEISILTSEDLFATDFLVNQANLFARSNNISFQFERNAFSDGQSKFTTLTIWLNKYFSNNTEIKKLSNDFKTQLYGNCKKTDLIPDAFKLVEFILSFNFNDTKQA